MAEIKAGMTVVATRDEPEITKGKHYEVFNDNFRNYVTGDSNEKLFIKVNEDNLVPVDEKVDESLAPNMVDSPPHYNAGKYEVIDIIEDSLRDIAGGFEAYCLGNVEKYTKRYRHKNGVEDLRKAAWYLNKAIEHIEARS